MFPYWFAPQQASSKVYLFIFHKVHLIHVDIHPIATILCCLSKFARDLGALDIMDCPSLLMVLFCGIVTSYTRYGDKNTVVAVWNLAGPTVIDEGAQRFSRIQAIFPLEATPSDSDFHSRLYNLKVPQISWALWRYWATISLPRCNKCLTLKYFPHSPSWNFKLCVKCQYVISISQWPLTNVCTCNLSAYMRHEPIWNVISAHLTVYSIFLEYLIKFKVLDPALFELVSSGG